MALPPLLLAKARGSQKETCQTTSTVRRKKGGLYFNENGADKGFGDGGIVPSLKLSDLTSTTLSSSEALVPQLNSSVNGSAAQMGWTGTEEAESKEEWLEM